MINYIKRGHDRTKFWVFEEHRSNTLEESFREQKN